jgi:hypothetical protein
MDQALWNAWLDFSAAAMKGAEGARRAMQGMAAGPSSPENLSQWMAQWFPEGRARSEDMIEVLETWWKTLGVVPRQLHEEVLKQNRVLQNRLQDAEATISRLRRLLAEDTAKQAQEQAEVLLAEWEKTTRDVLDTQADLARRWSEGWFGKSDGK